MPGPSLIAPVGIITPDDPSGPVACCHGCGDPLVRGDIHHSLTLVKGARVNMHISRPFCCAECRLDWWTSEGDPIAEVHTPESLAACPCDQHSWSDDGQGGSVLTMVPQTPLLHVDDLDLRTTVIEHHSSDGDVRIVHSNLIEAPLHLIVEMWMHDDAYALNDWWQTSISMDEHLSVRARFDVLKSAP